MRTFNNAKPGTDIEVARWEQYVLGRRIQFGCMRSKIPPGATSPPGEATHAVRNRSAYRPLPVFSAQQLPRNPSFASLLVEGAIGA